MDEKAAPIPAQAKGKRVKRKKVQASDGWTVVTHTERKQTEGLLRSSRATKTVDGLTVPRLLNDFKQLQVRWKETSCAEGVTRILEKRTWRVENVVCIGIGSFSLDWEHRHRSMWQLVLFVHVIDLLPRNNTAVPLYAQEPLFTSLDKAFLQALNVTIIESGIETYITPLSFIFSPFVDWSLLLPVFLHNKDPEIYVGNVVLDHYQVYSVAEEKIREGEECSRIGKMFLGGRTEEKVPEFGLHAHALDGLVVYWKVNEEEEG